MQVFFRADDYDLYRHLLLDQVRRRAVAVWAYCLMPNHIHLIAAPTDSGGLARALAETHRRYAARTNARHGWRGHLWQERFWSFAMNEVALRAVTRYVLLNPVRAGLASAAADWPFSSARLHLRTGEDPLVDREALDSRIDDWDRLLREEDSNPDIATVRRHSATGRPLGDERFLARIERLLNRRLRPRRPGRPRNDHRSGRF